MSLPLSGRALRLLSLLVLFDTFLTLGQAGPTGMVAQRILELQATGGEFPAISPLPYEARSIDNEGIWAEHISNAHVFGFDHEQVRRLLEQRHELLSLALPLDTTELVLLLERVEVTSDDFSILTSDGSSPAPHIIGLHYRGIIENDMNSLVAISIFDDEVMGLISDISGQRVLGALVGDRRSRHILYRDRDVHRPPTITCSTPDAPGGYSTEELEEPTGDRTLKCVRLYWESAYDIFVNKGSVQNVTNYLTGLFNQSASIYHDDGINVVLSQLFIWTSTSPYNATSSFGRLQQFGNTRTSFNGDLAHLLDFGNYGGVAWLDVLCYPNSYYRMAYSGISSSFNTIPAYSWTVMVVTHEQGHNMGSKHTHACAWNGNNTAIDGCGPTWSANYSEGSCPIGPIPTEGGTIMSYCHANSAGMNFGLGFGTQPKNLILNRINNAACLNACSPSACNSCPAYDLALTATNTWQTTSGAIGPAGCSTYRFNVIAGTTYTFKTGCGDGATATYDTYLELVHAGCNVLAQNDNGCGSPAGSSALTWTATYSGYMYVRVKGANGTMSGSHTLAYRTNSNCTSCTTPDFTITPSTQWQLTSSGHGANGCRIYQIPVQAGNVYTFKTGCGDGATASYDTFLELYGQTCGYISGNDNGCESLRSSLQWTAMATGTVHLRVRGTGSSSGTFTLAYSYALQTPTVSAKAILDGPYNTVTGLMRDDLRANGLLPLGHPYGGAPFNHTGSEIVPQAVLGVTGNNAIVDWVLIELRDPITPSLILASRAALLQRDGDVVDLDGIGPVTFPGIPAGNYHLAVRHRNHLAVMTAIAYALGQGTTVIDLTSSAIATYGTGARRVVGNVMTLWGGNANGNTNTRYTGLANDKIVLINAVGANTPTATINNTYHNADLNMNGNVRYSGLANDKLTLINTVGASTPTTTIIQQLP